MKTEIKKKEIFIMEEKKNNRVERVELKEEDMEKVVGGFTPEEPENPKEKPDKP